MSPWWQVKRYCTWWACTSHKQTENITEGKKNPKHTVLKDNKKVVFVFCFFLNGTKASTKSGIYLFFYKRKWHFNNISELLKQYPPILRLAFQNATFFFFHFFLKPWRYSSFYLLSSLKSVLIIGPPALNLMKLAVTNSPRKKKINKKIKARPKTGTWQIPLCFYFIFPDEHKWEGIKNRSQE